MFPLSHCFGAAEHKIGLTLVQAAGSKTFDATLIAAYYCTRPRFVAQGHRLNRTQDHALCTEQHSRQRLEPPTHPQTLSVEVEQSLMSSTLHSSTRRDVASGVATNADAKIHEEHMQNDHVALNRTVHPSTIDP